MVMHCSCCRVSHQLCFTVPCPNRDELIADSDGLKRLLARLFELDPSSVIAALQREKYILTYDVRVFGCERLGVMLMILLRVLCSSC